MRRVTVIGCSGAGKSTLGCLEHFDPTFLRYVWNFHAAHQPRMTAALEKFAGHARLHRLESRNDAERFMATIERR